MQQPKRNFTGLIAIIVSVALSLGIGVTLYYFKTQQNERVQNQLHFSELALLSNDISNAFSQIQTLANLNNDIIVKACEDDQVNCKKQIDKQIEGLKLIAEESPPLKQINIKQHCASVISADDHKKPHYLLTKQPVTHKRSDDRYYLVTSIHCLSFSVPLNDFVSTDLNHLSFAALTDEKGNVLSTLRNNRNNAFQHSLTFTNVATVIGARSVSENTRKAIEHAPEPAPHKPAQGFSTFSEHQIGGDEYRIYRSPVNVPASLQVYTGVSQLYVMGMRSYREISIAKLYVSPDTATAIVVTLALLLAALPLIKLRLVSHKYCFKRSDAQLITLGLLLLVGYSAIYGVSLLIQQEITQRIDNNAALALHQIKTTFKQEVRAATAKANYFANKISPEFVNQNENEGTAAKPEDQLFFDKSPSLDPLPNAENLFKADEKGNISKIIFRTHEKFKRNTRPNISHRKYFKTIYANNGWPLAAIWKDNASLDETLPFEQFYIQRIFNITDSRKSSQFAWLLQQRTEPQIRLLSGAVNVQSLKNPLLPRNMKFVIFHNVSGEVLYSSNDTDSLVENFHIASGNSPLLNQYLQNAHGIVMPTIQQSKIAKPFKVAGSYHGREVDFYLGHIIPQTPWSMAIIYDKEEFQYVAMLATFAAMILLSLLLLGALLIVKITLHRLPWQNMLLYRKAKTHVYLPFSLLVLLLISVQLLAIFMLQDLMLHMALGLLSLLIIKRMAGIYLLPSRRVKHLTMISIIVLSGLIALYAIYRTMAGAYSDRNLTYNGVMLIVMFVACSIFFYWFHKRYKNRLAKMKRRDIKQHIDGYALNVLALTLAISFVPAVLFTTVNYHFFMQQLTKLERLDYHEQWQQRVNQAAEYFSFIGHPNHPTERHFMVEGVPTIESSEMNQVDRLPVFWSLTRAEQGEHISFDSKMFVFAVENIAFTQQLRVLDYLAGTRLTPEGPQITVQSHQILKQAINNNAYWLIPSILLFLAFFYYVCREMISRRFLGVDLSDDFRSRQYHYNQVSDIQRFNEKLVQNNTPQYALILRPTRKQIRHLLEVAKPRLFQQQVLDLHALLMSDTQLMIDSETDNSLSAEDAIWAYQQRTLQAIKESLRHSAKQQNLVILKNLGAIAFNRRFRQLALQFIEFAMAEPSISIVILADVSPLYKLTQQYAYPNIAATEIASLDERTLWSSIFARFSKYYDWNPRQEQFIKLSPNILTLLHNETSCWPEMKRIRFEFYEYHYSQRLSNEEKVLIDEQVAQNDANTRQLSFHQVPAFKSSVEKYWTAHQLYNFICEHAGAIFRYRWEQCTKHERMLLYNLATDHLANPLGYGPLSHLIRRGYIVKHAIWRIASESFRNFILTAESGETFQRWLIESEDSVWRYVRIPILTFVLVLVAVLIYSATEAIESIVGLLTALLTLTPLVLKNTSLLKGSDTTLPPES